MVPMSQEIPFSEWVPDLGQYSGGLNDAKNCVAYDGYYGPIKQFEAIGNQISGKCIGSYALRGSDGTVHVFAATSTKIYKKNGLSWDDVTWATGDYTTSADGFWIFTNFGDLVIATNYTDDIQVFDVSSDTEFSQLSSTAPQAKFIFVLNNFLVCLDTIDSDGSIGNRVRWSPIGDPTGDWTPDIDTQAGFNDLVGGGYKNTGGTGTDSYGTILQDKGIWRMQYVGGDQIFTFDLQVNNRGTTLPRSVTTNGALTYFIDVDGFCLFNGTEAINIGENKVNRWFFDKFNSSYSFNLSAAIDPINKLWAISFPTVQGGSPDSDLVLLYNYKSNKFTYLEIAMDVVFGYLTTGYTLETLSAEYGNLELVPYSLDSTFWQGGDFLFGGIDTDGYIGAFAGNVYTATIATPEIKLNGNGKTTLVSVLPLVEQGSVRVSIGSRDKLTDNVSYTDFLGQNSITSEVDIMKNARYARAVFELTDWDIAKGYSYRSKSGGIV